MQTFNFMDGTSFQGKVLAKAFNIIFAIDPEGHIFLVNINNLTPELRKSLRGEE